MLKKIILYIGLIVFLLFNVIAVTTSYEGESADVIYYKLSVVSMFSGVVLCFAAEIVYDKIKKTKSTYIKLWKRLAAYVITIIITVFIGGMFGENVSHEFMDSLVPETTAATTTKATTEPTTEAITKLTTESTTETTVEVTTKSTTEAITTKPNTTEKEKKTETVVKESKEKKTTVTTTEKNTVESTKETVKKEKDTTKKVLSTHKTTQKSKAAKNIYLNLTDKQFITLIDIIADSFYSFSVSESDKIKLDNDSEVESGLKKIYNYAYKNHFELDPDFVSAFAKKEEVVRKCTKYTQLKENFDIGYKRDSENDTWIYTIKSYTTDPKDEYIYDDVLYLDAEGYLNKGVVVYWEEEGKMVPVGEIVDIVSDEEIDGTVYGYGLNVKFYDDPDSSGWRDGESFLTSNKKMTGRPTYFINALDVKRNVSKQKVDYIGSVLWQSLKKAKLEIGMKVYIGQGYCKTYQFTIKGFNKEQNILVVEYESGSVGYKYYDSIVNNKMLFVKR